MIAAGIIDPTLVVRCALADASSVASLMTTTEALIADPEGQVGALLEFLDLSWDAGCLAPLGEQASDGADSEQESSAVSALQEGRWRNYEAHIGPLLSAFGSA